MHLTTCVFLCYTVNEDKKGGFSMAFCPQCGAPLPDGAKFCMSCSARITAFGSEGSSALRMFILKNSGLITTVAVGLCINLVLSFISNLLVNGVFAALVTAVMSGLTVWALFSFLRQAKRSEPIPAAGFTVIKVVAIIELVAMALVGSLMLLSGFVISSEEGSKMVEQVLREDPASRETLTELGNLLGTNDFGELFGFLTVVMFVIGGVCVAFIFLYGVPLIKNCNAMRNLVTMNVPVKLSRVLPVTLWIIVGLNAFSLLLMAGGILGMISSLIAIAVYSCGALLLRNASQELLFETTYDFNLPGMEP